jgi:hypothetical protein
MFEISLALAMLRHLMTQGSHHNSLNQQQSGEAFY